MQLHERKASPESHQQPGQGLGRNVKTEKIDSEQDPDEWLRRVRAAKRAARSELSVSGGDWKRRRHANSDVLSTTGVTDSLERVHWKDLSAEQFAEKYESKKQPVVITGVCDDWPACAAWTEERLLAKYGDHKFKVGSDDDGYAVRLKLEHFLRYMHDANHSQDDSPLYIFDGSFAEKRGSKHMRRDYSIPSFFEEDLMHFAGESRRPPYRWFVMGPARSGSYIHVDPLATSAWNALIHGRKRWALFPPGTPKALLQPKGPDLEREAVSWFRNVHPSTQQHDWPGAKPIDVIQNPGEIMYVPGGWWHTVMNLSTPTTAVTHNYASSTNFREVWAHSRRGRPKFSAKWLGVLGVRRPDLARVAHEVIQLDEGPPASSTSSSSSSSSSGDSSSSSSSSSSSDDESDARRPLKRSKPQPAAHDGGLQPRGPESTSQIPLEQVFSLGPSGACREGVALEDGSRSSSTTRVLEAPPP